MKKYFKLCCIILFIIVTLGLAFFSCKKAPGEGGKATIKGSIWVEDWNSSFSVMNGEYAGADVDVYIIYGDEVNYGDKIKANYNGEFEFKYLRKGKYKVYVYTKDKTLTSASDLNPIVKEVEITEKKQTLTIDRITIYQ